MKLSRLTLSAAMLPHLLVVGAGLSVAHLAQAQDTIYRCGNEYINDAALAKRRGCKTMEGGNITVIQGPKPQAKAAAPRSSSGGTAKPAGSRIDTADQRARDSDARDILQSELDKAQARLDAAKKAYANGEPEKQGIEGRNYQRYLDRVAELKAEMDRAQSDVTSIGRELGRMKPAAGANNGAATAQ